MASQLLPCPGGAGGWTWLRRKLGLPTCRLRLHSVAYSPHGPSLARYRWARTDLTIPMGKRSSARPGGDQNRSELGRSGGDLEVDGHAECAGFERLGQRQELRPRKREELREGRQ